MTLLVTHRYSTRQRKHISTQTCYIMIFQLIRCINKPIDDRSCCKCLEGNVIERKTFNKHVQRNESKSLNILELLSYLDFSSPDRYTTLYTFV